MFPAPMRAMCAQVWLVPTSARVLHTLERGTAAYWGGGEAQEAACGGGKVAIPAILTRLPGLGGTPCAYRIARSRRSAVPYTAWSKCRQRGGQLHGIGDSLLRSQSRAVSPRCMGGTKKSSCDFSVLCGPGELYHVPITCTNAARPSEELFPDLHDFSRSDFGLGAPSDD